LEISAVYRSGLCIGARVQTMHEVGVH